MAQAPEQKTADTSVKKVGLLRSSLVFSVMTMLSRILGLVRDVLIAALAGATAHADAFFVAFKIPQFLRRLFAEGAFSQAFVPVLSEYRSLRSFDQVKLLIDKVSACLGLSVFLVTGIAIIAAPVVATIFAPGFIDNPEKFDLTVNLIRITFPYLFFITLTGFAGAVLNSFHRFAVPALTPVILNLWLIVAATYGAQLVAEPVYALAFGVFLAGICQFLFQIPFLMKINLLPSPKLDFKDEGVRQILTLMIPALFGVSVSQINLLLDTIIASFLPTGSISWLYYSDRLVELPLGVFAIAVSTVILPSLSRKHATLSNDAFAKTMNWGMRMIFFISIPAAVALLVLAEPILITLFKYGKLSAFDVKMSSFSLMAYSIGLVPMMLIKVLASGFYSKQDMKTPVRIGIIAMVSNMGFNLLFALPLHYYLSIGFVGLALATSASALVNAALLWGVLIKRHVFVFDRQFLVALIHFSIASSVMVAVLLMLIPDISLWSDWVWHQRVLELALLIGAGLVTYLAVNFLLGTRIKHFRVQA